MLGHGVTGNKDRPVVVDTADALTVAGFIRFASRCRGRWRCKFDHDTAREAIDPA